MDISAMGPKEFLNMDRILLAFIVLVHCSTQNSTSANVLQLNADLGSRRHNKHAKK